MLLEPVLAGLHGGARMTQATFAIGEDPHDMVRRMISSLRRFRGFVYLVGSHPRSVWFPFRVLPSRCLRLFARRVPGVWRSGLSVAFLILSRGLCHQPRGAAAFAGFEERPPLPSGPIHGPSCPPSGRRLRCQSRRCSFRHAQCRPNAAKVWIPRGPERHMWSRVYSALAPSWAGQSPHPKRLPCLPVIFWPLRQRQPF